MTLNVRDGALASRVTSWAAYVPVVESHWPGLLADGAFSQVPTVGAVVVVDVGAEVVEVVVLRARSAFSGDAAS